MGQLLEVNGIETKASLVSQGITYTAKKYGSSGNYYSVTVVDIGVGLSYIDIFGAITIDIGGTTPTAAQVVAILSTSIYSDSVVTTPGTVVAAPINFFSGGTGGEVNFKYNGTSSLVLEHGSSFPVYSVKGQIFWKDDSSELYVNNGSSYTIINTNASVLSTVLTGFTSGSGAVSASDSILAAIQHLDGNDGLQLPLTGGTLTGGLTLANNNSLILMETTANGTDAITLQAPASVTTSYTLQLPPAVASAGQVLTDVAGNGITSWVTPVSSLLSINEQGASYPLVLTDAAKMIDMNVVGANTVTVPKFSAVAFPIGTVILVRQMGAGATTIIPVDVDVTIHSPASLAISSQYGVATLIKVATDVWTAFGALV